MLNLYIKNIILFLLFSVPGLAYAQIRGVITDSISNEPLMYISVYYEGKGVGSVSNVDGEYMLETKKGWNEITFSAIGYNTKTIKIIPGTQTLNIKMSQSDIILSEVIVKPKRERYSRKNNPAVDFMRKVIEHKSEQKLEEHEYYQFNRYQKMKMSLNDMTPEKLKQGIFKNMPFLANQLEVSPESKKLIIPISVEETASQIIYRKSPKSEKTIIKGMNSSGIQELFATGDMVGTILNDVFSNVNIYDNDIRLLQQRFVSPISNSAISFYHYFLMDTVMVGRDECVHLTFVPANSQDFGFTGHLYVLKDSTYAVKKCTMNLPKKTGVNFIESLDIIQEYEQQSNGQWVLTKDDMVVDLSIVSFVQGLQVRRTTENTNYSFEPAEARLFRLKGSVIKDADMLNRSDEFWAEVRQVPLTKTESTIDLFVNQLEQIPGFKYIIFVAKAFIENHVETGSKDRPSKFDFGPINTTITSNYVDGTRFRLSGRTTAKFNPHWFISGYGAYGLRDKKWKYEGTLTYAFNKREYFPWEFPRHNIAVSHRYDVMSPMDKFLTTDKDNVFVSMKTTTVDQMSYVRETSVKYEIESQSGFSVAVTGRHRNDEPTGNLHYFRNNPEKNLVHDITTAEAGVTFRYAPGETYVNTKQRRLPVSLDAPVYTLSHTIGVDVLGGEYKFNLTEASLWKRIWLSSWGIVDVTLKAGAQWNKVPFPLLILPAANLSYITQQETFTLINNMEFLNDRYASIAITYDMNGKLFNRIPLIKKLKWREAFRFRALVGNLTDKNNPYINTNDADLFLFPTRNGRPTAFVMDTKTPYMEFAVGIHNIFKLLHIEYVRRLTYLDNPNINKDGIRFMILMKF
jgi:hypothetical protein